MSTAAFVEPGDLINIGADPTIMKRAEWKNYRHLSFTLLRAWRSVPIEIPSTGEMSMVDDNNNENGDETDVTNANELIIPRNPSMTSSLEPNRTQEIASTSYSTLNDVNREGASLNRLMTELDNHDIRPMIHSSLQGTHCSMNTENKECDTLYSPESSTQLAQNKITPKRTNIPPMHESRIQTSNKSIPSRNSFSAPSAPSMSQNSGKNDGSIQEHERHAHSVNHNNQSAETWTRPLPHCVDRSQKSKSNGKRDRESSSALPSAGPSTPKIARCRTMFGDKAPITTNVDNAQALNATASSVGSSGRIMARRRSIFVAETSRMESNSNNMRDISEEFYSALLSRNADDLERGKITRFHDLLPLRPRYDDWEQYKK